MKKIIGIFSFLVIAFFLNSCSYSTFYLQSGAKNYSPANSDEVKFYSGDKIGKEYEIIGSVATFANSKSLAIKNIKLKAASIGANGIININLDKINSSDESLCISGVAIRIK